MTDLANAIAELVATFLRMIGHVGDQRRRAGIRDDLELLGLLEGRPQFGAGTQAHEALSGRITLEVARLSRVELSSPRKERPWASIALATGIWGGLGYLTYELNHDGFAWYSIFPAAFAFVFFIATVGMAFPSDKKEPAEDGGHEREAVEQ